MFEIVVVLYLTACSVCLVLVVSILASIEQKLNRLDNNVRMIHEDVCKQRQVTPDLRYGPRFDDKAPSEAIDHAAKEAFARHG